MKTTDTIYRIELTEAEVRTITEALEEATKERREHRDDGEQSAKAYFRAHDLRNGFAHLIGRSYMGVDA